MPTEVEIEFLSEQVGKDSNIFSSLYSQSVPLPYISKSKRLLMPQLDV